MGALWRVLVLTLVCTVIIATNEADDETTFVIPMPPVQPSEKDEYICFAHKLNFDEAYFHSVDTKANAADVHHAGIGFCDEPISTEPIWACTHMTGKICTGPAITAGGWDDLSVNAKFQLPKDVGFKIGRNSPLKYVVFQVHFRGPVKDPTKSVATVTLVVNKRPPRFHYQMFLLANYGHVPARSDHGFISETACPWTGPSVNAYSYVIHTHLYGVMVEGFLVRDKRWTLLGSHLSRGRSKRRYNVTGGSIEVKEGDILAARCLYINHKEHDIAFGHGIDDEMCNFMLDFAYRPEHEDKFNKIITCNEKTPDFSFCNHPQTAGIC